MKNNLKYIISVITCILTLLCCVNVYAADLDFGKPTRKDNVTTLPLNIVINEGDKVTNVKIGCETNDTDVSCTIEANQPSGISVLADSTGYVYSSVSTEETGFITGTTLLANLIITNDSTSKKNVTIRIKGATITLAPENEESTARVLNEQDLKSSINTDVNQKLPEKVYSSDATLKNVKISQGKLNQEFDKDVFDYIVYDIQDTINSIKFTPECNEENTCSYSISGGKSSSGSTVTLNQGENNVKILVESEDGKNKNTYTFKVYRGETDFNSSTLKSLEFKDYKLDQEFSKETLEYTVTVPNSITSIKGMISYNTTDDKAKVTIKDEAKELVEGDNAFVISVVNGTGDNTTVYKLTVKREAAIGNITIIQYINNQITFKTADNKEVILPFDDFKVKYPSEATKISNNEYKFDDKGMLITGTNEIENVKNDDKTNDKKDKKIWLIVILISLGLIIIIVSGYFIFRKKPKKETSEIKVEEQKDEQIEVDEKIDDTIDVNENIDKTIDVDEALSDLMNTKQYNFGEDEEE